MCGIRDSGMAGRFPHLFGVSQDQPDVVEEVRSGLAGLVTTVVDGQFAACAHAGTWFRNSGWEAFPRIGVPAPVLHKCRYARFEPLLVLAGLYNVGLNGEASIQCGKPQPIPFLK